MGSRFPSHQLSNGLYVSGRPEQPKEKPPTISSTAMPYTGGDIKKSGELGKMFDLHVEKSRKSGPLTNAPARNRSFGGSASNSGPIMPNASAQSAYPSSVSYAAPGSGSSLVTGGSGRQKSNSGPLKHVDSVKKSSGPQSGGTQMARQNSGPLTPVLPTTGLITSGPITSGPLNSSGAPRKVSGPLDTTKSMKTHSNSHSNSLIPNQAVTNLSQENDHLFRGSLPKPILWSVVLLFVMGFIAGGFILGAVHNPILLIVVVAIFGVVVVLSFWNSCLGRRSILGYIAQYPDADLREAQDGQYVKVTGVITCGNFPLESSYHKVPRCVYTSTALYEYRGWESKTANSQQRRFTWGLRSMERHVVDFYISDFQSGLRALVKAGYGSKVTPYVDESVIDINPNNKDMSPEFLRWLQERNMSSDDRQMSLKEGYIKEGSTVSIMGIVRKNENVLMIVPPSEPFSTGCQWPKCILSANLEGIILRYEDTLDDDAIPV